MVGAGPGQPARWGERWVEALQTAHGVDNPEREKVNVFFLSDGSAGYPASVLQQLRYDTAVWGKIEMEALGFGH